MDCHQILSGACNAGDKCFAIGTVEGVPFTVSVVFDFSFHLDFLCSPFFIIFHYLDRFIDEWIPFSVDLRAVVALNSIRFVYNDRHFDNYCELYEKNNEKKSFNEKYSNL